MAFLPPREYLKSAEAMQRNWTISEAEAYTRWLATHHYENFHIASFLLPRRLHQDFFNVYGFCRWADDLGDEIGDRFESERLLRWWEGGLKEMYGGQASHPVYVALRATIGRHALPIEPFQDLICAFLQDQHVSRYRTYEELFAYCRCSANPVGRLVLHLCGYSDERRQALSDSTCTALQLANFWQDVAVDLEKDRLYLPQEALDRHGCRMEDVFAGRVTSAFRAALKEAVGVARQYFVDGLPLARMVDRRLAVDIALFSRGGIKVLEKIEAMDYDVLSRRPKISRAERAWLLITTVASTAFAKTA